MLDSPLRTYLEANAVFWEAASSSLPATFQGNIIVDLMHDNQWYLRWNLLTAKYLQHFLGGGVIAIQYRWETPSVDYREQQNRWLAYSFGVDEVIDLDVFAASYETNNSTEAASVLDEVEGKLAQLRRLEGTDFRRHLQALALGGNPDFGWLAYDTYLRTERLASLSKSSEQLESAIRKYALWSAAISHLVAVRDVRLSVLGHIEYLPYAFLAQGTIDNGGEAYFLWPLVPGTLRRFRDRKSLRRGRGDGFVDLFKKEIVADLSLESPPLQQFRRMFQERFSAARGYRSKGAVPTAMARRQLDEVFGLDENLPVVVLFSQALSDAVHANGSMLFDDFAQWIRDTIDILGKAGSANLLVKVHPRHRTYCRDEFLEEIERVLGLYKHVRLLPSTFDNRNLVSSCDVGVTVHGTPGYELVLMGMRMVTAGESRYGGLGIADEPTTKEEYFDLLTSRSGPAVGQIENAWRFAFCEFNVFRVLSALVSPAHPRVSPEAVYWSEEARSLAMRSFGDDPFFRALQAMLRFDRDCLVNMDSLAIW